MKKLYVGQLRNAPKAHKPQKDVAHCIVVDTSGSMYLSFPDLKAFLKKHQQAVQAFEVIEFASGASRYSVRSEKDVESFPRTSGGTNASAAINALEKYLQETAFQGKNTIITWISDGESNTLLDGRVSESTAEAEALTIINKLSLSLSGIQSRLKVVSCNYGESADTKLATGFLTLAPENNEFHIIKEKTLAHTSLGNAYFDKTHYALYSKGDGFECMPEGMDLPESKEPLFLTASGVLGTSPHVEDGMMFCLSDKQPLDSAAVRWREVSFRDTSLLEKLSDRIRLVATGYQFVPGAMNLEAYQKSVTQTISMLVKAVESLPEKDDAAEGAFPKKDWMSLDPKARKAHLATLRESRIGLLKNALASKQETTLLKVLNSLLNSLEGIRKLDQTSGLYEVNALATRALDHRVMARMNQYDVLPIDRFSENLEQPKLQEVIADLEALKQVLDFVPERDSVISLATQHEWVDAMLKILDGPVYLEDNVNKSNLIKEMFEVSCHLLGLPAELKNDPVQAGFSSAYHRKMRISPHTIHTPVSISDALLEEALPTQAGPRLVNAIASWFLGSTHLQAFLKKYNFDTMIAAMILRHNPLAEANDALALQALGLDAWIDYLTSQEAPSPLYIARMLQSMHQIAYRGMGTVKKLSALNYQGEGESNLKNSISNYKPKEVVALLSAMSFEDRDTVKDVLYEALMASPYLEHKHRARLQENMPAGLRQADIDEMMKDAYDVKDALARVYLIRKALSAFGHQPVTLSFKHSGTVSVKTEASVTVVSLHKADGTILEKTLIPYGAKATVKDGEYIEAFQNIISFEHNGPEYAAVFEALAGFDIAEQGDELVEYVKSNYPLDKIQAILSMPKEAALKAMVEDLFPEPVDVQSLMDYSKHQFETTDRALLPTRSELPTYLVVFPKVMENQKIKHEIDELNNNSVLLTAKVNQLLAQEKIESYQDLADAVYRIKGELTHSLLLSWDNFKTKSETTVSVGLKQIVGAMADSIVERVKNPEDLIKCMEALFTQGEQFINFDENKPAAKAFNTLVDIVIEQYGEGFAKSLYVGMLDYGKADRHRVLRALLENIYQDEEANAEIIALYANAGISRKATLSEQLNRLKNQISRYFHSDRSVKKRSTLLSYIQGFSGSMRESIQKFLKDRKEKVERRLERQCTKREIIARLRGKPVDKIPADIKNELIEEGLMEGLVQYYRTEVTHFYENVACMISELSTFKGMTAEDLGTIVFSLNKVLEEPERTFDHSSSIKRGEAIIPTLFRGYLSKHLGDIEPLEGYVEYVKSEDYLKACQHMAKADPKTIEDKFESLLPEALKT